ncbi:hypothetical protein [Sulfuricurvum sp.]|uniref:hypothetical protein n=1 Tax=Sulfuricurvum sp. TaxID=2025608 RepID=UPI0026329152|nr:hypothetical protein [Sulfuricurvum sp.]MDD2267472.1 hypothetical protein [Sulfuricurvum sp.]MDD2782807.1 hypothetical protein [Sulfuricurvum sp.]
MSFIQEILDDINTISDGINTNALVEGARGSVTNGLKAFMITPKEKASIQANFEMQFTGGIISKIVDTVMQGRITEIDIEIKEKELELKDKEIQLQNAQLNLALKEIALRTAQIDVMNREIALKESQSTAQISQMNAETALKSAQKLLVDQQKLTETNTTVKVGNEAQLLSSNKALVDAQVVTEGKRKLDVMAGINIKNEQALSTRQSAKFEETRRFVLIGSTQQNGQIQKSKEENATLNALALDANFGITDTHLTRVRSALDGITLTPISYTEELTSAVGVVDAGT